MSPQPHPNKADIEMIKQEPRTRNKETEQGKREMAAIAALLPTCQSSILFIKYAARAQGLHQGNRGKLYIFNLEKNSGDRKKIISYALFNFIILLFV